MRALEAIRQRIADALYPEGQERRDLLERLADVDDLTGLANRRAFNRALPAAEADPDTAVVMLDLDRFKPLNDFYGHKAGDLCLQSFAAWIWSHCESTQARPFRYGGDEFAVLCPAGMADQVVSWVQDYTFHWYDKRISCSVASGETLACADQRMLAKKRQNGDLR